MTADSSTGRLAGCSSSGAFDGGSIRKSIKDSLVIKPNGSYHPFACNTGPQPPSNGNCSKSQDGDGEYYQGNRNGTPLKMYVPTVTATANAEAWTRDQNTTYVARQCFTQDATGVYNIDTSKMPTAGGAGYELLQSNSTSLPTPPDLGSIQ